MRVSSGKVVSGQVVVEGVPLEEGATVVVLAPEPDESFALSAEDEAELLRSIEEAERGEVVSGDQLLDDIGR